MRRILLAKVLLFAALLLASAPLAAYVIYLKDGGTLQAREKYREQGALALITLPSGAQTTLPLDQIDAARTKAANATDFGSATVLTGPPSRPTPTPTPRGPTLAELAAQRRPQVAATPARPPVTAPTSPAAARVETPKASPGKTTAGYVDFSRLPRTQVSGVQLATTVGELLRSHGVSSVGIFEGSQPRRLLLDVTANSEGSVFQAVGATAQALLELEAKQPGAINALELFITTEHRGRAGQFLMTSQRAQELVSKKVDLATFFLKYVEF